MNDELRQRVRAIGAALSPEMFSGTIGMYAPKALKPEAVGARVERDIAYGPHARHKLDLFLPAGAVSGAPVLLFVHGGGFVQGDKGGEGAPFYNNVGAWAASQGFVGVTITYRLAPDYPWPAGAEDLAAAIDWVRANVAKHGGERARIFVSGQSSGAAHVASYVAASRLHGSGPPIAGAIMLSGFYDVVRAQHSKFENAYYGMDASRFAEQSSLRGLIETSIPLLFTIAEYDGPTFQNQAALLAQDWFAAKGSLPRLIYLPDGNHMSAALSIGTPGNPLSAEIAAFMRKYG